MDFQRSYDVVVVGGGVAGIAAALESARNGYKTALIEKTVFPGGLATSGMIQIYLPLCDGFGQQIIGGIAEELLRLSIRYGPGDVPANWHQPGKARLMTHFSPSSFILALDEVLGEAGVELWLDTVFCSPVLTGNTVSGIEVENKTGRGLILGKRFVDASGDADLLFRAGAECMEGQNWLSYWAHVYNRPRLENARLEMTNNLLLHTFGGNNAGEGHPAGAKKITGLEGEEVTRFILDGRRMLRERLRADHSSGKGLDRHNHFAEALPAMPQLRTTRRIHGVENLDSGLNNLHYPSSIGLVPDWRKPGPVWEVPYGILVPRQVRGVLAAGRCVATGGDAWEVFRVIPPAALTGQLAALASWLSLRENVLPDSLSPAVIQAELRLRGERYHLI